MRILSTAAIAILLMAPLTALAGQVDINSADAETISAELKGVGLSKAKAIVEYRKKHGPFRSADDLSLVKGIGERTVELNRSDIKVSGQKK
ncbi:MAG: helix-hairpin-helix domain-containing protein [Gammaproteobacteria bacterium]|jgi:competence protein ComEA|nr:helix-hairpin-helix domain-containing protein [Gammaproteobacteria bacterium]